MFERFTDRARRVVVLAQEEARRLNHNYIGTEHILLGLIHEGEGVAAQVLTAMGVSLDDSRERVENEVGRGKQAPSGDIPFTPRAKKVFELSLREALLLAHSYVGTEHILLGLIREGEGVAARTLVNSGVDLITTRQEVFKALRAHESAQKSQPTPSPTSALKVAYRSLEGRRDTGNERLRLDVWSLDEYGWNQDGDWILIYRGTQTVKGYNKIFVETLTFDNL